LAAVAMNPAICLGMTGQHRYVAQAALGGAGLRLALGAVLMSFLGLAGAGIAAIVAAIAVDIGCIVTRACRHLGVPIGTFLAQAIGPTLPGLLAAVATTVLLGAWHAPVTLGVIAAQGGAAMAAFVAAFAVTGLPKELFSRRRRVRPATEGVLVR
jgi:hypothetical protein